ncbi:MAG: LytR C-terminal domain-containing protein [Spirochaetes bacterium]|nr:LytR C-terminal domain-containing protein [Spirochaetota bacterium]
MLKRLLRNPRIRRVLVVAGALAAAGLAWLLLRYGLLRPAWETRFPNLVTVLVMAQDETGKPASAHVLFFHPQKGYLHIYRVNPEVSFRQWWGSREKITEKSIGSAVSTLEKTLRVPIPYYVVLGDASCLKLVERLGGLPCFNEISESALQGETVITADAYENYLSGVKGNASLRQDAAFHLWFNGLLRHLEFHSRFPSADSGASALWASFDETNLPKGLFYRLFQYCAQRHRQLYVSMSRMNVEEQVADRGATNLAPLEAGRFDADKLKMLLGRFEVDDKSIRVFPVSVQVKNATEIPRLAAKTAGILRLKKCDVREYLNTRYRLKHSVLVCRSGSAAQRDYMQKVTKIERVYYDVDWRDGFDFSVVLGEDYYAIPYLTNRQE